MARRQRQRRRRGESGSGPTQPHRDNVPGALDHASGIEEEFEAAIVSGAGGDPVETGDVEDDLEVDEELEEASAAAGAELGAPSAHRPASGRGGTRAVGFLRACWAELQRVQWPDRRQVFQATAVVLGFVVVAGAYLGVADYVAKKIVDFIL